MRRFLAMATILTFLGMGIMACGSRRETDPCAKRGSSDRSGGRSSGGGFGGSRPVAPAQPAPAPPVKPAPNKIHPVPGNPKTLLPKRDRHGNVIIKNPGFEVENGGC